MIMFKLSTKFLKSLIFLLVLNFNILQLRAETIQIGGASSAKDVWYSLQNGKLIEADANNWDLAFGTNDRTSEIYTNDAKGVELYLVGEDFKETFNSNDQTNWVRQINSEKTWLTGSFNQNVNKNNPFDFGWGVYNIATHNVLGRSVYILKLANGSYKKIFIDVLDGKLKKYTFLTADLDGNNKETIEIDYSKATTQNIYYSFETALGFEREPKTTENWELLFCRYTTLTQGIYYPVTGIKTSPNVLSLRVELDKEVTPSEKQIAPEFSKLEENITSIGYDWKTFNQGTYSYAKNRVHFLQRYKSQDGNNVPDGDLFQIVFTKYTGGQVGEMEFTLLNLSSSSIENGEGNKINIYPSEINTGESVNLVFSNSNDKNYNINLIDVMGNQIYSSNFIANSGLNNFQLNSDITSNLSKGMYFINIKSNDQVTTLKFILQ